MAHLSTPAFGRPCCHACEQKGVARAAEFYCCFCADAHGVATYDPDTHYSFGDTAVEPDDSEDAGLVYRFEGHGLAEAGDEDEGAVDNWNRVRDEDEPLPACTPETPGVAFYCGACVGGAPAHGEGGTHVAQRLGGMLFNFTMNDAGWASAFEYPHDVADSMWRQYDLGGGNEAGLNTLSSEEALAICVGGGCDFFKQPGVGIATSAKAVHPVWQPGATLIQNLEAAATAIAAASSALAPKSGQGFVTAYLAFTQQRVMDPATGTARPLFTETAEMAAHGEFPAGLKVDPYADRRAAAMESKEGYCHQGDSNCTCPDQNRCPAVHNTKFPPSTHTTHPATEFGQEGSSSLPALYFQEIVSFIQGDQDDIAKDRDASLRRAFSRGHGCDSVIKTLNVHYSKVQPVPGQPQRVSLSAQVPQSYDKAANPVAPASGGKKDERSYSVIVDLLCTGSGGALVVDEISGAFCPCTHGVVRCTHIFAVILKMYFLVRNTAGIGMAKQAPRQVPSTFGSVHKLKVFSTDEHVLEQLLANLAMDSGERDAVERIFKRKVKGKGKIRTTTTNAGVVEHAAACRSSTRRLLAEHKEADAAGAYLVQGAFQLVAPSRNFYPSRAADAELIPAEIMAEMDQRLEELATATEAEQHAFAARLGEGIDDGWAPHGGAAHADAS